MAITPDAIISHLKPDEQFRDEPYFVHFSEDLDMEFLEKLQGDLHTTRMTPQIEEKLKKKFLELFARCCVAREVAYQMRLSPGTVFKWRHEDKSFATSMDKIRQEASIGILEEKAMQILSGPPDPKNHILLMFMMKSYGRQFFDDKFVEVKEKKQLRKITVSRAEKLPDDIEDAIKTSNRQSFLGDDNDDDVDV